LKKEGRCEQTTEFLAAMLRGIGNNFVFQLLMDSEVTIDAFRPWVGECAVTVPVVNGIVDMSALFGSAPQDRVARRWVATLAKQCEEHISLVQFLTVVTEQFLVKESGQKFGIQAELVILLPRCCSTSDFRG
jgi:hypothetical protein